MYSRKVGIVGVGNVGSHVALSLINKEVCGEIVLCDIDEKKAKYEAVDCMDTAMYMNARVRVRDDSVENLGNMDIIVISIGIALNVSANRLNELEGVLENINEIIPKIKISENPEKITNPGFKKIYRLFDKKTNNAIADLICLKEENIDFNDIPNFYNVTSEEISEIMKKTYNLLNNNNINKAEFVRFLTKKTKK